jgi:hypothetical protein
MFVIECKIEKIFYSGPNPQVILQRTTNDNNSFVPVIWRENIKPSEGTTVYLCLQTEDLKCIRSD